jgi:hypothetical protein
MDDDGLESGRSKAATQVTDHPFEKLARAVVEHL